MTINSSDYLFGPVPSHRLGRSLGVDPFGAPHKKTCTLDCVFCEVGSTRLHTTEPFAGPNPGELAQAVVDYLRDNPAPNYITVSGSGEPTLWLGLGPFLRLLRGKVAIPLAVLTNSTTLLRDSVLKALACAHVVLPTLTTVDEETFVRIHAPLPGVTAELCYNGIRKLRQQVDTEVWLEVLLLRGINDDKYGLSLLAEAIREINPHKVQITTLSRPGRMADLVALGKQDLQVAHDILAKSGIPTEIVVDCVLSATPCTLDEQWERVGSMLRLRWISLPELAAMLGLRDQSLWEELEKRFGNQPLERKEQNGIPFVHIISDSP